MRALILTCLALLAVPSAASAAGLTTGYLDGAFGSAANGPIFDQAAASGAEMVRLPLSWNAVAPSPPAGPRDPADPGYDWSGPDAAIAAAKARGLKVLLSLDGIPSWAQGKRPKRYPYTNAYKPSVSAVRAFAVAVGKRYASSVRYVQLFNEPNLSQYLAPQWEKGKPFAPLRYRALLNAAYPGLHAAGMKLVTAGTAPYGDPGKGTDRIRPRRFWRIVLRSRARFDILAHHPYAIGGPRQHAISKDDIAVPDVYRLRALVRPRPVWVTEIGWDSRPPDPHGIPMKTFSHWVADSMYVLYRQGVDHVFWFLVRDAPPKPSFDATRQSGIYYASGKAKPALRAFRFPFSCERRGSGTRVWLRAPVAGRVAIESGGRVLRRLSTGPDRVAAATLAGRPTVRARSGSLASISCRA